jgi:hypothetical protein
MRTMEGHAGILKISASFSTAKSISSGVLYLLKEKRIAPRLELGYKAPNTCEPVVAPLEHALPPEAEMPWRSRLNTGAFHFHQTRAGIHLIQCIDFSPD